MVLSISIQGIWIFSDWFLTGSKRKGAVISGGKALHRQGVTSCKKREGKEKEKEKAL